MIIGPAGKHASHCASPALIPSGAPVRTRQPCNRLFQITKIGNHLTRLQTHLLVRPPAQVVCKNTDNTCVYLDKSIHYCLQKLCNCYDSCVKLLLAFIATINNLTTWCFPDSLLGNTVTKKVKNADIMWGPNTGGKLAQG